MEHKHKVSILMPKVSPGKDPHAAKTFTHTEDGWEVTSSYGKWKYYKGFVHEIANLGEMFELLTENLDYPVFMVQGGFSPAIDLSNPIRRTIKEKDGEPPTIIDRLIRCFCIDVDGWAMDSDIGAKLAIQEFIDNELPPEFSDTTCVYQLSSSFGLFEPELKAHLFFWLQEPVTCKALHEWAKNYNKIKGWTKNIIDPAIYTPNQPIYTQRRICEGAPDPVPTLVGYITGANACLDWVPEVVLSGGLKVEAQKIRSQFDISKAIHDIITGDNYHENIRGLTLSWANEGMSLKKIVLQIEGIMQASPEKDQRWQERFDDIARLVEGAIEIVDIVTLEDVCEWVKTVDSETLMVEFAPKISELDPVQLKLAIGVIDEKLNVGPQVLNRAVKQHQLKLHKQKAEYARKKQTKERSAQGIAEITVHQDAIGSATKQVSRILAKTKKKPQVFRLGTGLSIVSNVKPNTVRQCKKMHELGSDYPKLPIAFRLNDNQVELLHIIEQNCAFVTDAGKTITCPEKVLHGVSQMQGINWKSLNGIVEHPFVDDDWNIIQDTGYNEDTGLYAVLHHKLKLTPMSPADAYQFLAYEMFAEFPFASDLDRVAAVGCLLTAIQRPSITGDDGMPGFAITSPTQSSGKTTLAQLISYAAFNRPIAATSWSNKDEELSKHMLGILREGHSCVLFDNMPEGKNVKSNELTKAMTSDSYSTRPLGKNETETVPTSVLWMFTGNNIKFVGDLGSRVLPIRINPEMADPEKRMFARNDIGRWALDNRKKIMSAAISIIMEGRQIIKGQTKESRFKHWDKFVRTPLLNVCGFDLLDIFDMNKLDDDELTAKITMLELLHQEFQDEHFKVGDVINTMNGSTESGSFNSTGIELKNAIMGAFGEKATHNPITLGMFLSGIRDKVIGGFELRKEGKLPKLNWRVKIFENS